MKTLYEVSNFGLGINPIQVVSETEHMMTVQRLTWDGKLMEERRKKKTSYSKVYETFELARAALLARLVKNHEYHTLELERIEKSKKKVLDMIQDR